jgi:acetyl-CoA acyltransferase
MLATPSARRPLAVKVVSGFSKENQGDATMRDVVIVGYLRTAQSRSRPNDPGRDWFHKLRGDDLLGRLLPELVKRAGIDAGEVDDCITGSARGVAEQWTYGGRNPLFMANFPETVAAKFVDQQCGSAMAAIHIVMSHLLC